MGGPPNPEDAVQVAVPSVPSAVSSAVVYVQIASSIQGLEHPLVWVLLGESWSPPLADGLRVGTLT